MQKYFFIWVISFVCLFSFLSYAQTDVGSWIMYQNAFGLSRNLDLETELQLRSYNLNLKKLNAVRKTGHCYALGHSHARGEPWRRRLQHEG